MSDLFGIWEGPPKAKRVEHSSTKKNSRIDRETLKDQDQDLLQAESCPAITQVMEPTNHHKPTRKSSERNWPTRSLYWTP